MKIDPRFAESMAELRAAESNPSPDAALIAMCERYGRLHMQRWRRPQNDEERRKLQREIDEIGALTGKIPGLRPLTAAGRRAKAGAALASLERAAGTQNRMADAALRDYINNDAVSRPFMSGQLPENDPMVWDQAERTMLRMYRLMGGDERDRVRLYVAKQFETCDSQSSSVG